MSDIVPPQAPDTERAVLAACMSDTEALEESVRAGTKPSYFYATAHRYVWTAVSALYERGVQADLLTVADELGRHGTLEAVGGPPLLASMAEAYVSPFVRPWIEILREKALRRALLRQALKLEAEAVDEESEAQDVAKRAIAQLADSLMERDRAELVSLNRLVDENMVRIQQVLDGKIEAGYKTGLTELDRILGGLQPTDLIIIAGRPSQGKTALACEVAKRIAGKGPVAFFTAEMSKEQITERFLCAEAMVSQHGIRTGKTTPIEFQQLSEAGTRIQTLPIHITDASGLSPSQIRAHARGLGAGLRLVVIDYLQLMRSDGRHKSRNYELEDICRSLKATAKELYVPVVLISQLSRAVEQRGSLKKKGDAAVSSRRPQLSDLRDSGAIEQDADVVMFVYRPEYYAIHTDSKGRSTDGLAEIIVAKQRNGPTGYVELEFVKQYARFQTREGGLL